MSGTETYNGWKNYPTWNVNLWLGNDQGIQEATLEVVSGAYAIRESRGDVAAELKEWVTDEDNGLIPDLGATMAADLLGYALDCVDWYEIADAWIETAKDQA